MPNFERPDTDVPVCSKCGCELGRGYTQRGAWALCPSCAYEEENNDGT